MWKKNPFKGVLEILLTGMGDASGSNDSQAKLFLSSA
jgi:hypothetical protein